MAERFAGCHRRAAVPSLPERVSEREEHLHARIGRAVARRQDSEGRLGIRGGPQDAGSGRARPDAGDPVHSPGRRQRRRPDGDLGGAAAARGAGAEHHPEYRFPLEAAEGVRADRLPQRFLLRRAVVPQDRSVREGRRPLRQTGRLELPPVPRELGILRGLRQLGCDGHGAIHLRGRRHGSRAEPQRGSRSGTRPRTASSRRTSTSSRGRHRRSLCAWSANSIRTGKSRRRSSRAWPNWWGGASRN